MNTVNGVIDCLRNDIKNWSYRASPSFCHYPTNAMINHDYTIEFMGSWKNNHQSISPYVSLLHRLKIWWIIRKIP